MSDACCLSRPWRPQGVEKYYAKKMNTTFIIRKALFSLLSAMETTITLHFDGACRGNPGPGVLEPGEHGVTSMVTNLSTLDAWGTSIQATRPNIVD